jgi:hypothetical protein
MEPTVVKQLFSGIEKDCIVVEVSGNEYDACVNASIGKKFWGNSKPGAYGSGLGKTDDDEFKPARTGLLGQMAFAKIFNQPVDLEYRKGGDKFDNKIGKYTYDVKCAMRNRGEGLIQHTNEFNKKNEQALSKDFYIFAYIESEDRIRKICKIVIVGYATRQDIQECETKTGYRGNGHLNYVPRFGKLRSIVKLLELKKQIYGN